MSAPHLFALGSEAICVAEDTAVAFYASKTLRKFRVERFRGARVCGLFIHTSSTGQEEQLYVIDAEANWFVLGLRTMKLLSSTTLTLAGSVITSATTSAGGGTAKPVIAARRARVLPVQGGSSIIEAHFCTVAGALRCVLLTPHNVQQVTLQTTPLSARDGNAASVVVAFPRPLQDCTMAVGLHTGLLALGQRGQRWLHCDSVVEKSYGGAQQDKMLHERELTIDVASVACSPVSSAVAVGGARGELLLFPSGLDGHHFADHWHHTPLAALTFACDGRALFTGARESVLLVWNLTSFTHRKIACSRGPIRSIVASSRASSQHQQQLLLLACGESTLALVDPLQMRVQRAVEGIEWSCGQPCRGLVATRWGGQPAVILTGLPNVLRICDPVTQQSLYSLHISYQMETIPSAPRYGIQFAGLLHDGRVLVTYEWFAGTVLAAQLRFWHYDAAAKRHIEVQTIYAPHRTEVLALELDERQSRVFTLSADSVKCWEEVHEASDNALANRTRRSWRNQSATATPSDLVRCLVLSPDGTLCFVADDCVHVYDVTACRPGQPWPLLLSLTQDIHTRPLRQLLLLPATKVIVGHDGEHRVFFWDLATPGTSATVYRADTEDARAAARVAGTPDDTSDAQEEGRVRAMCAYDADSVLVAVGTRTFLELAACPAREERAASSMGAVRGRAKDSRPHRLVHMQRIAQDEQHIAVVDDVSGFRVLSLTLHADAGVETVSLDAAATAPPSRQTQSLEHFFARQRATSDATETTVGDNDTGAAAGASQLASARRSAEAGRWLLDLLHEPAYTAPAMSSVLSQYLQQRSGLTRDVAL